jgi:small nuclear ribonucleoprotein (snRNP)-like protein
MTIHELKKFEDKIVILHLTDGERLRAKLSWVNVSSEYDDVIVDVIETSQPERYKDPEAAYTIPCGMIQSVEECGNSK